MQNAQFRLVIDSLLNNRYENLHYKKEGNFIQRTYITLSILIGISGENIYEKILSINFSVSQ